MSNRDVIASGVLIVGAVGCLAAGVALGSPAAMHASPDRSFGRGKGWVVTRVRGTSTFAQGVDVLPGGGIVTVGPATTTSGNSQLVVVRYRPNGQLDRTFGARGVAGNAAYVGRYVLATRQ